MTAAAAGFVLGLALIVPLGQQNVFVVSQGVAVGMPRALFAVVGAAGCDTMLILLGAGGASALLHRLPGLRAALLAAGVVILLYLGIRGLRSSATPAAMEAAAASGPRQVLARTAAVSLLNPHAIIDTVAVLGTAIAGQPADSRMSFGAGVVTASWIWFLFLASAAALLRKALTPSRRVWFDRFSGVVLLGFAGYLAYELIHLLRT
jgi:L-lysine exporter family protein LysE/ArgO